MMIDVQMADPKALSQNAVERKQRSNRTEVFPPFNHRLFLVSLLIILAIVIVAQVAGPVLGADVATDDVNAVESVPAIEEAPSPELNQFPSPRSWYAESPYAGEGVSISSGSAGIHLPK